MKKIFNKINKKVISCPQCKQKLRVPIKIGKVIRVKCFKCSAQFDLNFKSPLLELFQWYPGLSFKYNLKSFFLRIKALPFTTKFFLLALIMIIISSISSIIENNDKINQISPDEVEMVIPGEIKSHKI